MRTLNRFRALSQRFFANRLFAASEHTLHPALAANRDDGAPFSPNSHDFLQA